MRSSGSGAGASAWAHYRALAARDRRERLLVRALLACGAGVVAAGLSVWWAGPAVAAAAFAAQWAHERTRPGPAANWRRGAVAERRTGRRLARSWITMWRSWRWWRCTGPARRAAGCGTVRWTSGPSGRSRACCPPSR
ncbi:hypothetical protein ACQP1W_49350 [Spirillospora sp. CA-255316]